MPALVAGIYVFLGALLRIWHSPAPVVVAEGIGRPHVASERYTLLWRLRSVILKRLIAFAAAEVRNPAGMLRASLPRAIHAFSEIPEGCRKRKRSVTARVFEL
jgi:hypothetical protein